MVYPPIGFKERRGNGGPALARCFFPGDVHDRHRGLSAFTAPYHSPLGNTHEIAV